MQRTRSLEAGCDASQAAFTEVNVAAVHRSKWPGNRLEAGTLTCRLIPKPTLLGFMLSRGNENVAIKLRAILEVELASVPSEMKR